MIGKALFSRAQQEVNVCKENGIHAQTGGLFAGVLQLDNPLNLVPGSFGQIYDVFRLFSFYM